METLKTVEIKTLQDQLTYYLHEVQSGVLILITDKGNVIAELHKPSMKTGFLKDRSLKEAWIKQGKLMMPKTMKKLCPVSPVCLKPGTANLLLDQDRGQ
jgi:antitoxin (DNA-binding transcriptional repressor) of toxin-antitoxin stability system